MDPEKKARLGNRFTCFSCGTHFYDLNKPEPICPKCGADQREEPPPEKPKAKRTRKKAARKKRATINPALAREDEGGATADVEISKDQFDAGDEIELEIDAD